MLVPKPPVKTLVNDFIYREYQGMNSWQEPSYGVPVIVKKCRIDKESAYTSQASGRVLLYHAVIFCYPGLTEGLPESFKEKSLIAFDGTEYTLTKVIPNQQPYSDSLYSMELEVV
jgi:hypothetical protein|nr:MAG TPA: Minor capsid protein [Caudoviricetes sp.]